MKPTEVTNVTRYSIALMAITSIHHAYGAYIYNTPWRLHILMLSIPVILVTILLHRRLQKKEDNRRSVIFWIYWIITLVPSMMFIGLFEGMYNHFLKNVLFFGGLPHNIILQLFPPPTYELPNDLLFELTGVLQAVVFVPLGIHFIRLTSKELKKLKV